MQNDRQTFNERAAADFLGLSRQTLANWRCARRGPKYAKLSSRIIYRFEDLENFLKSRVVDPEADLQEAPEKEIIEAGRGA